MQAQNIRRSVCVSRRFEESRPYSQDRSLSAVPLLPLRCVSDAVFTAHTCITPVELSRNWARRVILAVGEREARLEAMEIFRGNGVGNAPRFVCPECHEFGCSATDGLDEHRRENVSWHAVHAALKVRIMEF